MVSPWVWWRSRINRREMEMLDLGVLLGKYAQTDECSVVVAEIKRKREERECS